MDIARPDRLRKKRRRQAIFGALGLGAILLTTFGLSRLEPAAPSVEKSSVWTNTVQRGEMIRQVRGNGSLIPEEIRWITTVNAGRIEAIRVLPGAAVTAETVIVELSNPELNREAFDAKWALKGAEAELSNVRVLVETQRLNQQAAVASASASFNAARLEYEVDAVLAQDGLIPQITLRQAQAKRDELSELLDVEKKRMAIIEDSAQAQQAVQQARVEQMRAQLELKEKQVEALKVRAGIDGVLQQLGTPEMPLRVGQQLSPGANIARVADPLRLKAEIRVAETQAKDIQLDQPAMIDTRNGVVPGKVVRIDPAVQNGTVTIDVALTGPLPKGARPDLSVDGTIQLERLEDVIYVGRPVQGQANSVISLFKLMDGNGLAVRVPVKLGRSSVSEIEVLEGLKPGDQVILSDMSAYDSYDRIRLK